MHSVCFGEDASDLFTYIFVKVLEVCATADDNCFRLCRSHNQI